MRKLTVIQALPAMQVGGVERCVVEISKALAGCGHRCIVISAGGGMVAELIADGSEHITLDIGKKSLTSLRHISTLKALFRETGADIVHAHSRLPAWLCYLTLKGLPMAERPRFVTTVHGSYAIN
ncbi:MAG: glycosyltransferase, partial [Gammaproteobacteria bacterium]